MGDDPATAATAGGDANLLVVPEYAATAPLSDAMLQVPAKEHAIDCQPALIRNNRGPIAAVSVAATLLTFVLLAVSSSGGGRPAAGVDAGAAGAAGPWPAGWLAATLSSATTGDGRPLADLQPATRGEACHGREGAVAATNHQATQAGLAVLAKGGNAADAAVAVQLMLGVAQPESNGIGGGCFIVVYNATTREVVTIDGREEAPAAFHPHVYCSDSACGLDPTCESCPSGPIGFANRYTGGLAVGVPGTLAAAARLLGDHGATPTAPAERSRQYMSPRAQPPRAYEPFVELVCLALHRAHRCEWVTHRHPADGRRGRPCDRSRPHRHHDDPPPLQRPARLDAPAQALDSLRSTVPHPGRHRAGGRGRCAVAQPGPGRNVRAYRSAWGG